MENCVKITALNNKNEWINIQIIQLIKFNNRFDYFNLKRI